jgi:hypothetical protein
MKNFDFTNPAQYGDWANYAGFNRTTGEIDGTQAPQPGVAPPENLQDYISQRIAPIENMTNAVVPAMNKLGQGNVMGAVSTMKQARNPSQQITTASTPQMTPSMDYDYTHGLE